MKTDSALQKDVMDEINFDPELRDVATEIGVTAKNGVVTISGMVDSYRKKIAVENAAQRVAGVKVIAVDVEVETPPSSKKSDIEIATAVNNALTWHTGVKEGLVKVKVDNGWIYLDGVVEAGYMKKAAELAINSLVGVRGITNKIVVQGKAVDPTLVKQKITESFNRSATLDAGTVHVAVSGNTVTLSGTVRSWAERNDAEEVAWSLPGVLAVENNIEIDTKIIARV